MRQTKEIVKRIGYRGDTHLGPSGKSKFNLKSDRVNLVPPASPIELSALFTQCPGDTVQTGTGKVDPAWKFICTTVARGEL